MQSSPGDSWPDVVAGGVEVVDSEDDRDEVGTDDEAMGDFNEIISFGWSRI